MKNFEMAIHFLLRSLSAGLGVLLVNISLSAQYGSAGCPANDQLVSSTRMDQAGSNTAGFVITGSVTGKVFWDANNNHVYDPGETGLLNRKIRLCGLTDDSAFTDQNGQYSFIGKQNGNYIVSEDPRTSWLISYPIPPSSPPDTQLVQGQIQIFKHLVTLAQDAYDYRIKPAVQGGGGGKYTGYVVPSLLTQDAFATYTSTVLSQYSIKLSAVNSFDVTVTYFVNCDSAGFITSLSGFYSSLWAAIIRPGSGTIAGRDFGNVPFEIRGKVFSDYKDAKNGIAGRRVNLHGPVDTFATTDANGDFVLRDFPWGFYTITETVDSGWNQTVPSCIGSSFSNISANQLGMIKRLYLIGDNANQYRFTPIISGGGGGNYTGYAIPIDLSSDLNGTYQVISSGPFSISLRAISSVSAVVISFTEDKNGGTSFTFNGNANVRPDAGTYFIQVTPRSATLQNYAAYYYFGNTQTENILGTIYRDINDNAVKDTGEQGLPGWMVYIGGPTVDSTLTDSMGTFQFVNLRSGTYCLNEGYRNNWRETSPVQMQMYSRRDSIIRNFNQLMKHLDTLAADACRWRSLSTAFGGGGGSFIGYTVPLQLYSNSEGYVSTNGGSSNTIRSITTSAYQYGTIVTTIDTSGKFSNFNITGDFFSLGFYFTDADSSSRFLSGINFGNQPLIDTILAVATNGGVIVPSGVIVVDEGSDTTVTFIPDTGYHVDSVLVDGIFVGFPMGYTFTNIAANHTIVVEFSLNQYTIFSSASGHGIVNPIGTVFATYGESRSFGFTADTGYHVDSLLVDGIIVDSSKSYTFKNISSNHTIHVSFKVNSYSITSSAGLHGRIIPSCVISAIYGDTLSFSILPDAGYVIDSVFVEDIYIGNYGEYTFSNIASSHVIRVSFTSVVVQVCSHLTEGWNMVSLPVAVQDNRKNVVFPNALSAAFTYEKNYTTYDTLLNGIGYWIKFLSAESLMVSGRPVVSETLAVHQGWNMIGSISERVSVLAITGEPLDLILSNFFGYDRSYYIASTIDPGKSYWVKSSQEGRIMLSSVSSILAKDHVIIVPGEELPPSPPAVIVLGEAPQKFMLRQAYPNPFNPSTSIEYDVPQYSIVTLSVYDLLGRQVATLVDSEKQEAGSYRVEFVGGNLASGVYIYRLEAINSINPNKRITLVKNVMLMR